MEGICKYLASMSLILGMFLIEELAFGQCVHHQGTDDGHIARKLAVPNELIYNDFAEFSTIIASSNQESNSCSDGIKCYQCNSLNDPYCDSLANETVAFTYLKPCENVHINSSFCRKIVQHVKYMIGSKRIIRRCGWESNAHNLTCKSFEDDDHKEIVCQCFYDGCNAANRFLSPSVLLMLVPLASYYML